MNIAIFGDNCRDENMRSQHCQRDTATDNRGIEGVFL